MGKKTPTKRPTDANQLAKMIVDTATGQTNHKNTPIRIKYSKIHPIVESLEKELNEVLTKHRDKLNYDPSDVDFKITIEGGWKFEVNIACNALAVEFIDERV